MSKRVDSASVTNGDKSITASFLFEAAISRQWDELSALCDQYDHHCDSPPNPNPLFAAVLHTAIVMAAKHKALSLFADVAPEEKLSMFGLSLVDDFCPFRSFDEGKDEARSRRKAIAKLCRIHPGWISAPLVGTCEKTPSITPNHGTTALHLAVRMRCPALVRLLLKYCPNAARVPDEYGFLPLHYAVRPVDEIQVYKKAIAMHNARSSSQNGLAGPTEVQNPNNLSDAGGGTGGGVSFGMRMVHRGEFVLNGISEMLFLARCRVKAHNASSKNRLKCVSAKTKRLPSMTAEPNATDASSMSFKATDVCNSNRKSPTRRSSRIKKNDEIQQAKAQQYHLFSNLYSSPSSLVRAMMFLGCVEEDSAKFITAESQGSSSDSQGTFAASWVSLRASRPWQTEQYRVRMVRMLTDVYPEGMAVACNHDRTEEEQEQNDYSDEEKEAGGGGGDTPFIIACRTLKGGMLGEDDDDEEFNMNMVNMEGHELPGDAMNGDVVAAARNQNDIDVVEAGEEEADYEADLKDQEIANKDVDLDKKRSSVESLSNLDNPLEDNGRDDVQNYNEQALAPVDNNEEEDELNRDDPLGAIRTMIAASRRSNDLTALLTTNDDGDTPLHTASRIGCHRRLVNLLLNAEPRPASMTAKDHATPLHLIVRRCSHLAPDGVGGLSTYDAETVQLMVNAARRDAMARCNSDFRTPLHEACYYGASPEVLEVLAEAEGGREALLLRDREGYSPLGTYCRHASDFYAMRVLCDHCPEAAACMAHGRRLPLHRVVASFNLAVNVDVLNLLGTAYPRGIDTKDAHGMTPLALLCHSYKGPMNVDLPKLQSNQTTLGRCLSNKVMLMAKYLILDGKANRRWNRSHMVISRDEDGNEIQTTPKQRLLHASLRDPASSDEIVQLAIVIEPKQLQERDEDGNTPLHLCCRRESGCTEYTVFEQVNEQSEESENDSVFDHVNERISIDDSPIPLETTEATGRRTLSENAYIPHTNFLSILHSVLKHDPSAARVRNNQGDFPFNILVDRGASWSGGGVDKVFKANPGAIFSYDLTNAVVVMAMGRVARISDVPKDDLQNEEAACLRSMYELLRGKPTVLEGANIAMLGDHKILKHRGTRRSKRLRTSNRVNLFSITLLVRR